MSRLKIIIPVVKVVNWVSRYWAQKLSFFSDKLDGFNTQIVPLESSIVGMWGRVCQYNTDEGDGLTATWAQV